ncbi:phosphatase PAP2 family protein [Tsuneonella flava]|uniref:phosphatase PAP2 family protein n=1 Tax=Tsuneonella flava TaxID=2055955 RepID=UPI001F1AD89A|nr:phosphatase PAP2 family protein [Tsuneonella flava]
MGDPGSSHAIAWEPLPVPISVLHPKPGRAESVDSARSIPPGWIVAALATSVVATAVLMACARLSIAPLAPGTLIFVLVFGTLGAFHWACQRPRTRLGQAVRDGTAYYALFMAFSLTGAVASYPVAALSSGYADPALHRIDLAMQFDWLAWYRTVADHRWLQIAGRVAYETIYLSPAILLGYCALAGKRHTAHDFIAATWLAALLTLIAFYFIPAIGPLGYLMWRDPVAYLPISDLWQPTLIPLLRAHAIGQIDLGHLVGLVSAPSFHTAAGVLMIAYGRSLPPVRVAMLALNGAMLLATPVEGTHYLIDMILGVLVALAALALVAAGRVVMIALVHGKTRRNHPLARRCIT